MSPADSIELKLPFKAEYVGIARLTVSGIASRMGFDIDEIEDIKVATAEVCNKLVLAGSSSADSYRIDFRMADGKLNIHFYCEDKALTCIFEDDETGLGVSIIKALMDNVELCLEGRYLLTMTKSLEGDT